MWKCWKQRSVTIRREDDLMVSGVNENHVIDLEYKAIPLELSGLVLFHSGRFEILGLSNYIWILRYKLGSARRDKEFR